MKLHTKLVLSLVAVLIVVVAVVQILQLKKMTGIISNLSRTNIRILKEREEGFAKNIHQSIERAVAGSLERGEMVKFSKLLQEQRDVDGLLEFSLYDRNGEVSHSIDDSFLGKHLPVDHENRLFTSPETLLLWNEDAIEIFQPQKVDGDCIRCHTTWKVGEIGGVTGLRFSTAALNKAKTQATRTIFEMRRSAIFTTIFSVVGIILVFSVALFLLVKGLVSRPLESSVVMLRDIAEGEGDLTRRLNIDSHDEVGRMAKWFNIFVEKLQGMFKGVAGDVKTLTGASTDLEKISGDMSQEIDSMVTSLSAVAASTKEINQTISSFAGSLKQTSANVSMVAGSTEEMTATVKEIAQNTEKAHGISTEAVQQAQDASKRVYELGKAAQDIDKVTETIAEISEQTNLLALNATIESARAGEAGKGFAVVANEVKELARQTADATRDIKEKIEGIHNSTEVTIEEIKQISKVIKDVNDVISMVAAAAEEQSTTTNEIYNSISQTAHGIEEISGSIHHSSSVLNGVSTDIDGVNRSAAGVLGMSNKVNSNATELAKLANNMDKTFGGFKV